MSQGTPLAGAAEIQLLEAAQRAGRQSQAQIIGRMALVLHLSTLRPPAPRPHHRRIARAILQDAAQRHGGQVFMLRNGDFVLLCRETDEAARRAGIARQGAAGGVVNTLADALARLLWVDMSDPSRLVSVWPLEQDHHLLLAYATARAEERLGGAPPSEEEQATPAAVVDEIGALFGNARVHDLMQRQTAVVLLARADRMGTDRAEAGSNHPGRGGAGPDAATMRPIYREVTFSIAALEARISTGSQASADPFLFRHLAGQLDRRMLDAVLRESGRGGPLDILIAAGGAPPLHLNLTLGAILSPGFPAFAAQCRKAAATAGIEVSLIDACADTHAFAAAREAVALAGMALVLDGVSHLAMLLAAPWTLEPDLLKLEWSPRLADLPPSDRRDIAAAIAAFGANRIVLHRAETEPALRWGLAHGIRRFQGRHVDAMLGASRIMGCAMSGGCTLRQCVERAGATGRAARAGCANPGLLDAATPPRALVGSVPPRAALIRSAALRDAVPAARAPVPAAS